VKKALIMWGFAVALWTPLAGHAARIDIAFTSTPPLVEVEPGVRIVPGIDHEVYFADGAYWYFSDGVWYRTFTWQGGWRPVRHVFVPREVVSIPRGRYQHWSQTSGSVVHYRTAPWPEERYAQRHDHGHRPWHRGRHR
jgi:hypothetical protein